MSYNKPFCEACERNKTVICQYLAQWLEAGDQVLEIGSGTGQHGVYFTSQLPDINWQCTDLHEQLVGLRTWTNSAATDKLLPPFELDVNSYDWQTRQYQAVFSVNTLHIMSWASVSHFLAHVHLALVAGGKLIIYGPMRYQNTYTTNSNAEFDRYLKSCDPDYGMRDFERVNEILQQHGFTLTADQAMPANNQLLLWRLGTD